MKLLSVAAGVALLSVGLSAQSSPVKGKAKSGILLTLGQLGCSTATGSDSFAVTAWSWGASNSGSASSGGGGGAGKANVQDLSLSKAFDGCSPALFGGVVTGRHYQTLTLVQGNSDGTTTTVALTDVLISSWSAGGTTA